MSQDSEKIKGKYNRIARIYDLLEKPMDSMTSDKWRNKLIEGIEGSEVLEVGIGTGRSLVDYPDNLNITGIDFSSQMLEKARKKVKDRDHIELIEMDAEDMDFDDNRFDTIITSCVFCSVPDPIQGFKEIRRVCKNGGKIIMLEHMRSNKKLVGKFMDIINFIPVGIWGANINRRTIENLDKAGFKKEDIKSEDIWSDIVKFIEIRNNK